jgi:hypothetical protein
MSQISEPLLTGLVSVAMLPALTLIHKLVTGPRSSNCYESRGSFS